MAEIWQWLESGVESVEDQLGGLARFQVIVILAGVLGLDAADKATVAAVAGSLKSEFHINNTEIGLLIAAVSFVGAIMTLPLGVLVDRLRRRNILLITIGLWTLAMIVSGLATSFIFLLVARVFLGGVTAAAAPTVASLTGDFFPAAERAKIYGLILGGELIGFAFGFFVSGEVSSLSTWRWPFFAMSVPSAALIWAIWRYIPEPARGGQSWIKPGETHIRSQEEVDTSPGAGQSGDHSKVEHGAATAQSKARRSGVKPRKELVLKEDPAGKSLWWAIRYMLRIPTYVLLIIASSLGYYFFAGVRAFGMIYITGHYGVSRSVASALVIVISAGALVGLVLGGHLPRWLMKRGWLDARVVVPGVGLFLSALFFAPAIWTSSVVLGTLLLTVATFFLAAANPSFDAARLDIIHPSLWGRAESGRMALRAVLEGSAPLLFGALSTWLGGDNGLMWTFLIMLVPLFAASSLAIPARRTYLRDVETAAESAKQTFGSRPGK